MKRGATSVLRIPWSHNRCIICLQERPLTEEHIIPASLGGTFTSNCICRACNSAFGHGFEADARKDAAIRLAVAGLASEIPKLSESIEAGQPYVTGIGQTSLELRTRSGGKPSRGKLGDGSLLVPSAEAPAVLARMMKRDGLDEGQVAEALGALGRSPPRERVQLTDKLSVVEWDDVSSQMDFSSSPHLSALVPLKSAYEFLAMLIGGSIYDAHFDSVRQVLSMQDHDTASELLTSTQAGAYRPFHGLLFEGNLPNAQVQVRLFGRLAYRVTFRGISVEHPKFAVTIDLQDGEVDAEVVA